MYRVLKNTGKLGETHVSCRRRGYFFHLFFAYFSHGQAILREISSPGSSIPERVFSMLKAMFGDQQMETLADIIQTALMLRINKRKVG